MRAGPKVGSRARTSGGWRVPLLILHDEEDRDTPIEGGEAVARAWPRSRLVRTTGLGHRRILRDQQVLDELTEFLAAAL